MGIGSWIRTKTGLASLARKTSGSKVIILRYSRILRAVDRLEDYPKSMALPFSSFREQVQFLDRHFDLTGLGRYCSDFLQGKNFTRPTAIITLDGGYMDHYRHVAPLLDEMGLTASVFLPTAFLGTYQRHTDDRSVVAAVGIFDRRQELMAEFPDEQMPQEASFIIDLLVAVSKKIAFIESVLNQIARVPEERLADVLAWLEWLGNYEPPEHPTHMTWAHAKALRENGWELGALGFSAEPLDTLSAAQVEKEVVGPFREIQDQTGTPPMAFAYPAGEWEERAERVGKRTGYLCAVTEYKGKADTGTDLFCLPRLSIHGENAPNLSAFENLLSFVR